MNQSEEIKAKLDIVDVIGSYLSLKPAGSNFRAICPFHHEKTPSFMVSPDKQIWHCFGCGQGGDVIGFVMKMEGLDFVETLKLLAPRAGIVLKNKDFSDDSRKNNLLRIMELSRKYFNFILISDKNNSVQIKNIRQYLTDRGLEREALLRWQIGYSPDNYDDLVNFLKSKKFSDNDIFLAGMSYKNENGRYSNRFRDRIMFPINDVNGRTVAFTARINPALKNDRGLGKYINSPQTDIYDKSRILFGLDQAKSAVRELDEIILVEGQMDAISAYEAGFKNVSAISGTALTLAQLALIKRYTKNIILAFDCDSAGSQAVDRGVNEALKLGFNIKVARLENGKDPDEIVRKNPDDLARMIKEAPHIMEYYFLKELAGIDLGDVKSKNGAVGKILGVIDKVYNKIEQDFWLKELSQRARVDEVFLREELKKIDQSGAKLVRAEKKEADQLKPLSLNDSREDKLMENLLSLLLKFDVYAEYVFNNLSLDFLNGRWREFYNFLLIYYNKNKEVKYQSSRDYFQRENRPDLISLLENISWQSELHWSGDGFSSALAKEEIARSILEIKRNHFKESIDDCRQELLAAEKKNETETIKRLMEKLKELSQELKKIM